MGRLNLEEYKALVKCLIKQVQCFKCSSSSLSPVGWQKEYLRYLCRSIVNLQRAILQLDPSRSNLAIFFSGDNYKLASRSLIYDPFLDFRRSIAEHEALENDSFLFTE